MCALYWYPLETHVQSWIFWTSDTVYLWFCVYIIYSYPVSHFKWSFQQSSLCFCTRVVISSLFPVLFWRFHFPSLVLIWPAETCLLCPNTLHLWTPNYLHPFFLNVFSGLVLLLGLVLSIISHFMHKFSFSIINKTDLCFALPICTV